MKDSGTALPFVNLSVRTRDTAADGLQNQYVLYRTKELGKDEEVFLDPNTFSEDGTVSMSTTSFTKDGSLVSYQISEGGSDWRKVIVLDAESKTQLEDTLIDVKFSGLAWKGNEGFYYSSYDKPREGSTLSGLTQHHKLFFHNRSNFLCSYTLLQV